MRVFRGLKALILFSAALSCVILSAQDKRFVAVFEPFATGAVTQTDKDTVRDAMNSALLSTGLYRVVDKDRVARVLKDQGFKKKDLEDTRQVKILGRALNRSALICVVDLAKERGNLNAQISIFDVATGEIANTAKKLIIEDDTTSIDSAIKEIMEDILGIKTPPKQEKQEQKPLERENPKPKQEKSEDTGKNIVASVYVACGATFWKNGEAQKLQAGASSVFILGKDIYVVTNNGGSAAVYKNGALQQRLGDKNTKVWANSIFVSGNDIYVAGYQFEGDEETRAILWKNGKPQPLGDKGYIQDYFITTEAKSVLVLGADVYVAGVVNNTAMLWKNGTPRRLDEGWSSANAVFVSGADVYIAGVIDNTATLWKNGVAQRLSGGNSRVATWAGSIFVKDNDVYVAGYRQAQNERYEAMLWKNNAPQPLIDKSNNPKANSHAQSVFVSGKDVYVGVHVFEIDDPNADYWSYKNTKVILWTNDKPSTLGEGSSEQKNLVSVFVSTQSS